MTTETIETRDRAADQALAQLKSIKELVAALCVGNVDEQEAAQTAIREDALCIEVRSGWRIPGDPDHDTEYLILLCTGGPACRITGDLSGHHEPESARLEYQDWGTPWTEYGISVEDESVLVEYARQFWFGE